MLVTGTSSMPVYALFDVGASDSFIASTIISKLNVKPSESSLGLTMTRPNCEVILCHHIYQLCTITIGQENLIGDLVTFNLNVMGY